MFRGPSCRIQSHPQRIARFDQRRRLGLELGDLVGERDLGAGRYRLGGLLDIARHRRAPPRRDEHECRLRLIEFAPSCADALDVTGSFGRRLSAVRERRGQLLRRLVGRALLILLDGIKLALRRLEMPLGRSRTWRWRPDSLSAAQRN